MASGGRRCRCSGRGVFYDTTRLSEKRWFILLALLAAKALAIVIGLLASHEGTAKWHPNATVSGA
ncbi:hypothetical protein ACHAQJ_008315 [Trichoderma viride]